MKFLIISLLFSEIALAAGDGHGSVGDLVAPAVNFSILLVAIIYLLKDKAKMYFSEKSTTINEMMKRAESEAKEAELMMANQKKKMESAEVEIAQKQKEVEEMLSNFEKEYQAEVQSKIERMKEDAGQKIEAERSELLQELNASLLDQVIAQAKSQIKSDKNLSSSASNNIMKGL